jgi:arsenite/tail-anchored protein-transporting ATPase
VVELSFFIGKGGVGKTTLASAFAVRAATKSRKPVLLLSTDPAHSLADIFESTFGDVPRSIILPAGKKLAIWQINAEREFSRFLERYRDAIFSIIESGTIFTRKEIEPLLDSTLPGMSEVSALLAIHEAIKSKKYGAIVVDTAPFGHTLRLFEMPQHFVRFLNFLDVASNRDQVLAQTFGGGRVVSQPFLAEWRRMVSDVQSALAGSHSSLALVTTPEPFALNESLRVRDQLMEETGLEISEVILNRAVVTKTKCPHCSRAFARTRAAAKAIKNDFPGAKLMLAHDANAPVLGTKSLLRFAQHVFDRKKLPASRAPKKSTPAVNLKAAAWPPLATPLSFIIGKGGVGKTTVSAALAFHQRAKDRKRPVAICSTDPAPSLDDIFEADVTDTAKPVLGDSKFFASELDSVAEYRRWSAGIQQKLNRAMTGNVKGIHVDLSFDRQVISALLEIVPPGVDELFAIFRIMDMLDVPGQKVVIDMAPTGHALELLRMPERILHWSRLLLKSLAAHRTLPLARDIAVEVATISQRVRELGKMLRDGKRVQIWPVMLPEPLPDRETARLLEAITELGAEPGAVFVNRVIFADDADGCKPCTIARAWQQQTVRDIGQRLRKGRRKIFLVRNRPDQIAGRKALSDFTKELWQLA